MKQVIKDNINKYLFKLWHIIFFVIFLVFFVINIKTNKSISLIGLILLIIFYIGVITIYFYIKKYLLHNSIDEVFNAGTIQKTVLENLDVPYLIMDKHGDILWTNNRFQRDFSIKKRYYKNIETILNSEIKLSDFENKKNITKIFDFNDKQYSAKILKIRVKIVNNECLYGMYLFDNTEINLLKKKVVDEKLIQGLIYIDNYEDAMHDVDDIRKSLMASLLDRRIRKYFTDIDGVIQKFDKDKYYVLIKNKDLTKLQSDKFSLIEDVKKLSVGNNIPLTLSMGFSSSDTVYQESYEQAVSAVDMALARGGDQVVVKKNDKLYYYGGRAKSVEKNTRVKSRVKAHALKSVFENREKVIIMGHKLPDIDCVGAGIGVYMLARYMDKETHIVINDIINSVRPSVNKFIENSKYPSDMFISPEKAMEIIDKNTTLVVVDVNKASYTEVPELIDMAGQVVVIDHHRQGEDFVRNPVLSYVETSASSTCEMITEVLQYFVDKNYKIDQNVIDALYSGILIDTNYFSNRVGVRTFEAAAFLRKNGADLDGIRKTLRDDHVRIKAKAGIISDAYMFRPGFIIGSLIGDDIDSPTELGAQASNELLNASGVRASFVLTKVNDTIYISLRSIDDINVQLIAEKLGGGGHQTIAGAQLKGFDIDEAKNEVIGLVNKMLDEGDI